MEEGLAANSASVPSLRTAARATLALKAGAWLRRGRFDIGDSAVVANMSPGEPAVHSATLFRKPRPLHRWLVSWTFNLATRCFSVLMVSPST
jgi:hypothetical protein